MRYLAWYHYISVYLARYLVKSSEISVNITWEIIQILLDLSPNLMRSDHISWDIQQNLMRYHPNITRTHLNFVHSPISWDLNTSHTLAIKMSRDLIQILWDHMEIWWGLSPKLVKYQHISRDIHWFLMRSHPNLMRSCLNLMRFWYKSCELSAYLTKYSSKSSEISPKSHEILVQILRDLIYLAGFPSKSCEISSKSHEISYKSHDILV